MPSSIERVFAGPKNVMRSLRPSKNHGVIQRSATRRCDRSEMREEDLRHGIDFDTAFIKTLHHAAARIEEERLSTRLDQRCGPISVGREFRTARP